MKEKININRTLAYSYNGPLKNQVTLASNSCFQSFLANQRKNTKKVPKSRI